MKIAIKRLEFIRIIIVIWIAISVSGCIGLMPSPFRPSPGPRSLPHFNDLAEAFDVVCRNYRLGPDDSLRVIFQPEWDLPSGSYKLDNLDRISVKFLVDPNLNETVVIRPDGMITLQAIGDIRAAGLTPEELARRIEKKFIEADILSMEAPEGTPKNYKLVTVHVVEFYQKLARLVGSLTTIAGGQQTAVLVKPDGTIDLPLITERILAAGYTVREVENTINRLYQESVVKHATVAVALGDAKSRKFYVLGEVNGAGAYEIRQPITAVHALAMAGGAKPDTGDLTSVILISKNIHGQPIGRRLDLKRVFDVGDMASAIMVKPYDVLYVPRTYIGDLNLFMTQYFGVVQTLTSFAQSLGNLAAQPIAQ